MVCQWHMPNQDVLGKAPKSVDTVKKDTQSIGLKINVGKMKTLVVGNSHPPGQVKVDDMNVEDVK